MAGMRPHTWLNQRLMVPARSRRSPKCDSVNPAPALAGTHERRGRVAAANAGQNLPPREAPWHFGMRRDRPTAFYPKQNDAVTPPHLQTRTHVLIST